jgi:hypothetical protein
MKKVKFISSIASEEFSYKPGDEVSLQAATADAWIKAGHCVAVVEPEAVPVKKSKAE